MTMFIALLLVGVIASLPLWAGTQDLSSITSSEVIEKTDSDVEDSRTSFDWLALVQSSEFHGFETPLLGRSLLSTMRPTLDLAKTFSRYRRGPPSYGC